MKVERAHVELTAAAVAAIRDSGRNRYFRIGASDPVIRLRVSTPAPRGAAGDARGERSGHRPKSRRRVGGSQAPVRAAFALPPTAAATRLQASTLLPVPRRPLSARGRPGAAFREAREEPPQAQPARSSSARDISLRSRLWRGRALRAAAGRLRPGSVMGGGGGGQRE
ncbi:hypothetical protein J1605_010316 [Eschrichtius robustus]|uniref:Uncharacterized protein n=1 Tax=Eschrichtius robustus TaxID=9764 RepID=A0AB34GT63_ESCRO|nr:hypothetical protein J1605_010316 [Eschrichtius robustus]